MTIQEMRALAPEAKSKYARRRRGGYIRVDALLPPLAWPWPQAGPRWPAVTGRIFDRERDA